MSEECRIFAEFKNNVRLNIFKTENYHKKIMEKLGIIDQEDCSYNNLKNRYSFKY